LPIGRLRLVLVDRSGGGTGWLGCTGRLGGGVPPPRGGASRSMRGSMRVGSGSSDPAEPEVPVDGWPDCWPGCWPYNHP
jgi:hypothetical protein